ncbi:hypothetical protein [Zooshikella sp. RANM57]|uniref:hypothetical protein n=1 Tax=Zooshikella sp. RANM57 TaxID=3425863 RepID=UPI003D7015C9
MLNSKVSEIEIQFRRKLADVVKTRASKVTRILGVIEKLGKRMDTHEKEQQAAQKLLDKFPMVPNGEKEEKAEKDTPNNSK